MKLIKKFGVLKKWWSLDEATDFDTLERAAEHINNDIPMAEWCDYTIVEHHDACG